MNITAEEWIRLSKLENLFKNEQTTLVTSKQGYAFEVAPSTAHGGCFSVDVSDWENLRERFLHFQCHFLSWYSYRNIGHLDFQVNYFFKDAEERSYDLCFNYQTQQCIIELSVRLDDEWFEIQIPVHLRFLILSIMALEKRKPANRLRILTRGYEYETPGDHEE